MANKNHIQKVDWLREEIKKCVQTISKFYVVYQKDVYNNGSEKQININGALKMSYQHATEARFWLGFELERIKNLKV
jgi:hypothetical protein